MNYKTRALKYIKSKFKFRKMTAPQKKFLAIRKIIGLQIKRQFYVKGKYFDFYIPQYNMLIQVDGNYWHGKGLKFQQKNIAQKKNAANDLYKNALAGGLGYKIIRIWQDQITQLNVRKIISEQAKT